KLPGPADRLRGADMIPLLDGHARILDVPGHTAGHIAYLVESPSLREPVLFCGDTLFCGGCGRLFEGTAAQMLDSLDQLAALPPDTLVCAAHEYTLSNLKFAREVEPGNTALAEHQDRCQQLRSRQRPTLPSSIDLERRINPFLRVREPSVARRVAQQAALQQSSPVHVFAALREWKNLYR
ncbi:MAG: hydroxyacylglutathione hydrolase, partial [Gammaproteobacteria bacterium]